MKLNKKIILAILTILVIIGFSIYLLIPNEVNSFLKSDSESGNFYILFLAPILYFSPVALLTLLSGLKFTNFTEETCKKLLIFVIITFIVYYLVIFMLVILPIGIPTALYNLVKFLLINSNYLGFVILGIIFSASLKLE
ncbi:MAG: hypothetical protein RR571_06475 [Anaerorhabdus sp.]